MSVSNTESSASSFSSAGGSSIASDNTDSRALNALQSGPAEDDADGVESNNKSIQEGVFATIYTLTMNRTLDTSVRIAVLKVVLEFLQIFRVLFNTTWAWSIQKDLWIFKSVQWLLIRQLLLPKGYDSYVAFFYFLVALILASIVAAVWVALVLKGDDASNVWVKRLIGALQIFATIIYTVFWVAILDYAIFFFDCQWTSLAQGLPVYHMYFTDTNCLAMPHMAHMLCAGVLCIVFCGMTLVMSIGYTDLNPMTRSWLASSDATSSFKILALKMMIVIIGTGFDCATRIQVVLVLLAVFGVFYYHIVELPYYVFWTNLAWTGLWTALLALTCSLVNLEFTLEKHAADPDYAAKQTMGVLYVVLSAAVVGAAMLWARVLFLKRTSTVLTASFEQRKQTALASYNGADVKARAAGASIVTMLGELKGVYRYKDARQISLLCRDMRKWDEDGIPDPDACEYGEFVLKSGMARMPNNPALLVSYASFLIEVRKDGQGARTQLQLAQKANPSWLDNLSIYVAQQLAKQLKREGDGLDLMGYVEYQRNYRSCVRVHKLALLAQRSFWNSLLRSDKIAFKELQRNLKLMEETEARATATYRRVLERYPNNGKLLKVYGRFLEYVRNDPWTASKFYTEALKQGTTESLLNLTKGQSEMDTTAFGTVNEKTDGLIIISAQGSIMMVNAAAVAMFGYEKGELEGKNINVLMPQPISSQHNGFLQRYVDTRQPHILDKTRLMVGLQKNRSMFPISLCATRLAGMGSETLFMGVVRRVPAASADGGDVVRFWTTASGLILCADASAADCFGLDSLELVGQSFANLCTDVEGVTRYIAEAGDLAEMQTHNLQAQLLHTYLPAVDVELSVTIGGTIEKGSDCRIFIVQARMLVESQATMALDYKGRLVYATDKLSTMLGYPAANLMKMELNALLPPPYCQMHGAWFRDSNRKPTAVSCRSGAVVHLLAANGTKVPVTLKMSVKEAADSKHSLHIVQVFKSSESAGLDQQRLLLEVNHAGVILQVNQGVPKTLFGFNASDLVGRPLAAILDVFGLWRHKHGEDSSLLMLLASQALRRTSVGAADSGYAGTASWRVGVHQPVKTDLIGQHAAQLAGDDKGHDNDGSAGSLIHMLQQRNKLTPACMVTEMLHFDEQLLEDEAAAVAVPVMQVSLYRSDALSAIIELDKHLGIARADESAGLMLGVSTKQLLKKSFPKLIGLPPATTYEELLGIKNYTAGKKGAMKSTGATSMSRMGVAKKITVQHLGDAKPLVLEMQAMSYDQAGKTRMLVRLQLQEPSSASMSAMLLLKEGKDAAEAAAAAKLALADGAALHSEGAGLQRADSHNSQQSEGEDAVQLEGRQALGKGPVNVESFKRTSDWVRETSTLPESPGRHPHESEDEHDHPQSRHKQQHSEDDDEAAVYISTKQGAKYAGSRSIAHGRSGSDGYGDEYRDDWKGGMRGSTAAVASGPAAPSGPGSIAESASIGGSASIGDGQSEAGGGSISSAAEGAHDEDLAVDARRAKRLKKLNRIVQSGAAQAAPTRWRRHTLALLAVVLVAHVACFIVLTLEINRRFKNAVNVANMAKGLDRFQSIVLRSNFVQKCWLDEFRNKTPCVGAAMDLHMNKLLDNINIASSYHSQLYLGPSGAHPFSDPRLLDYWTYHMLPERRLFNDLLLDNGTAVHNEILTFKRSLWELGNVLVAAARDVHFNAAKMSKNLQNYFNLQYIIMNGPDSIFKGYSWSLDTFVEYAWTDLQALSITLIVLLVVEVVVLLFSCIGYEFHLLQQCNVSHMRLFSVFLALPSATVRLMAQRQLPVDDENKNDIEEDEAELLVDAAAATNAATAAAVEGADEGKPAAPDKKKSVRVVVEESSDDDDAGSPRVGNSCGKAKGKSSKANDEEKPGRSSGKSKVKGAAGKANKTPLTGYAAFKRSVYKLLFGWMDPKFKRNGKKLVADNSAVFTFMVPLVLWMAAVVIIFGVSYKNLQGLQGPLASLDTGAHVLYRMARSRLMSNMLAFSVEFEENAYYRAKLKQELDYFEREYNTLLYGGKMMLQANVTFDPVAPAGAFTNPAVSNILFRTKDCLRRDQSTCITSPQDGYYAITHNGLDTLVLRYLSQMTAFSMLPDNLAVIDHPTYMWAFNLAGNDLYDGLQTVCDLFVAGTIAKFENVKVLHVILLVITLVCTLLFVLLLYRPYIKLLHHHSKAVAGMLSQLPAEVDVEGHMKSVLLGMAAKPAVPGAAGMSSMAFGRPDGLGMGGPAGMMQAGSMMQQGVGVLVPSGAVGMQIAPPAGFRMAANGYGYGPGGEAGAGNQRSGWFGQHTGGETDNGYNMQSGYGRY